MYGLKIGDFVSRKSYGGDVYFTIENIHITRNRFLLYTLRGVTHRLLADATPDDLVLLKQDNVDQRLSRLSDTANKRHTPLDYRQQAFPFFMRPTARPGTILHLDGDSNFLKRCEDFYGKSKLRYYGYAIPENQHPQVVGRLLSKHKPDILVITGHDAQKKSRSSTESIDNYSNSKYFIESVKEGRRYEPNFDKLCIFAGACQSYYEGIMSAGANFASSPGRILINALDPAIVSEKVALTDYRKKVTPQEIGRITESGSKGVSGVSTKGRLTWR